jgi:hypothetical protein
MNVSLPRVLLLISCLLPAGGAFAVEVTGLFEAAVPVANQGASERAKATAEGFRQVLVKASGQRAVLLNAAVQQELGKAESLLGSYRYESARAESPAGTDAATVPRIRLKFDPGSVLGVLNRGGAPVWSASRPMVYLWVFREAAAPSLFALGTPQADVLLDAAGERGLPVAVPAPGDVPGPSGVIPPQSVVDAAARVGAKVVLAAGVGPVPGQPGKFRAMGVLRVEGSDERLDAVGADESAALRELVAVAADLVGGRYAVVARKDQVTTVRFRVDGVVNLAAWAALERWLNSQPLLRDAVVARVDASGTEYTLTLAGELERLLQALRADGRFTGVGVPVTEAGITRVSAVLAVPAGQ